MEEFFNGIKIRKIFAVNLISIIAVIALAVIALEVLPSITIDDITPYAIHIPNILVLLWFTSKRIKAKVSIGQLIEEFKGKVKWGEICRIFIINVFLSIGFSLFLLFVFYKTSPDLFQEIFQEIFLEDDITPENNSLLAVISMIIGLSFLAPIVEELTFRGVILKRLKNRWGINISIIVSSIVFGLLHGKFNFVAAAIFGIMLTLLYIKTNNILIPITVHILNNSIASLGLVVGMFSNDTSENFTYSSSEIHVMGLIGFIMLGISIFFAIKYMIKNWPKAEIPKMEEYNTGKIIKHED